MKHLFIPSERGTHIRTADSVRGNLKSYPDTVQTNRPDKWVDPAGYTEIPADPPTVAECIKLAEAHVGTYFTPLGVIACQNKIMQVQAAGTQEANPKLVATYAWMMTVQGMAVAGQSTFPAPPHPFDQVIAE